METLLDMATVTKGGEGVGTRITGSPPILTPVFSLPLNDPFKGPHWVYHVSVEAQNRQIIMDVGGFQPLILEGVLQYTPTPLDVTKYTFIEPHTSQALETLNIF